VRLARGLGGDQTKDGAPSAASSVSQKEAAGTCP